MTYSKITKSQFDEMQFDAGVWVRSFNILHPEIQDRNIICATSGGISLSIVPRIVDNGEGVYMMPKHTAEMMQVTGWDVGASFSAIGFGGQTIQFVLGASESGEEGIVPRLDLHDDDFEDCWWLGDRVDGGLVAVHLLNALSDEGVDIQTEQGKAGQIAVHLTAHASMEGEMGEAPVEIYSVSNRRPTFDVVEHRYLVVYNSEQDEFEVDEDTGHLFIYENSGWSYRLDEESGKMEVSK